MSMIVKHKPATPLPWKLRKDHESTDLLGADGDCVNSAAKGSFGDDYKRVVRDMNYERHAANAYPKLVAALRGEYAEPFEQWAQERFESGFVYTHEVYHAEMRHALLSELGEDA